MGLLFVVALVLDLFDLILEFAHINGVDLHDIGFGFKINRRNGRFPTLQRMEDRARQSIIGQNFNRHTKATFNLAQMRALLIENIESDLAGRAHSQIERCILDQGIFNNTQHMQRKGRFRAH